jgi:D-alanine-D-alanine ligase
MTTFLTSGDTEAVHAAAGTLRAWQEQQAGRLGVALVYGGLSAEDQLYISKSPVEQLSITALTETLLGLGVRFSRLDPTQPYFVQQLAAYDVALSNLHGPYGEDGRWQGLMDYLRVPYCGSGVQASAVCADKILCKRVMASLGVPTPLWWEWTGGATQWSGRPVMVKPPLGGSSVGMSLIRDEADLLVALAHAQAISEAAVLVEEFVPGAPVTVGMLELPAGQVLVFPPLATRVSDADFYDADTKLGADAASTVHIALADLPDAAWDAMRGHAQTLWDGIGLRGTARVDFIVTAEGDIQALEVNTTPGMSRDSNFVTGAALCGFDHAGVVTAMLHEAVARPTCDVPLPVPRFATALFDAAA